MFLCTSCYSSVTCMWGVFQLMNVLQEDEFARNYQLANKLQKVHLLMRVRVWRCRSPLHRTSADVRFAQTPNCSVCRCVAAASCYIQGPPLLSVCRVILALDCLRVSRDCVCFLPSSYCGCSWLGRDLWTTSCYSALLVFMVFVLWWLVQLLRLDESHLTASRLFWLFPSQAQTGCKLQQWMEVLELAYAAYVQRKAKSAQISCVIGSRNIAYIYRVTR